MSQPIDVGSVLSGRYQVTETVLSSADGDLVLSGIDQVLNRSVSIMVASVANSSQLATSAREIAMGQRTSNVQVLDLGITDSNQTYLVANVTRSSDLLDLVVVSDEAPYVEPFFTDTLGTEIFGVSREAVPETYEDDEEYYDNLRYEDEPAEQGKLGSALSSGFAGLKNRFGRKNQQPEPDVTSEDEEYAETAPTDEEAAGDPTAPHDQVAAATVATPVAPKPEPTAKPKVTKLDSDNEPNVTATAALAAAAQSKGQGKETTPASEQAKNKDDKQPNKTTKSTSGTAKAAAAGSAAAASRPVPPAPPVPPVSDPQEFDEADDQETTSKGTRLLVGAVLVIVLVIGVVFAFNFLGGDRETTADGTPTPTVAESPTTEAPETESSEPAEPELPKPEIADVSRLVPGNQELNSETDDTLPKMIDGNESSSYKTYSFTTSNFGGFASNMVFILELEEKSAISEINLAGLNATGGSYEILVGSSDDLGDASKVATGSFSGPSISVTVKDDDKDFMEGQYIFLNVTDLPRRASGANESRPFGLQIGEFSAK